MVFNGFDAFHRNEHNVKILSTISDELVHREKSESAVAFWDDAAESDMIIFLFV